METLPVRYKLSLRNLVPTRWGTQLNGNSTNELLCDRLQKVPTRWGTQLNGNDTE